MEHIIKVNRCLISKFHEFDIGKGAKFDLRETKKIPIMINYLCDEFLNDPYCLVGNIGKLFRIQKEIEVGKKTYCEYLEAKLRGSCN